MIRVLALSTLRESSVDVLLLDIQMPDLDGLNLSRMGAPRYEGDLHDRL